MQFATGDLQEDLIALAECEFRVAQDCCVGCTDYHALFGYGRLAQVNKGITTDGDMVKSLLEKHSKVGARVLIAGAADAGLLALTARALLSVKPDITVVDRCTTPLVICESYAKSHGLKIRTFQTDLTTTALLEPFDVILTHNILVYIPGDLHSAFLNNMSRSLASMGTLILVNRVSLSPSGTDGVPSYRKHRDIPLRLATKGIPLPEDEVAFRRRIERLDDLYHMRVINELELPQIEANLAGARLRIRERIDHSRRAIPSGSEGQTERATTYIFVTSHAE